LLSVSFSFSVLVSEGLMGRENLSPTAKALCFQSIELQKTPTFLVEKDEVDTVFGTSESAYRKSIHQYRWKRSRDRKNHPKRYVEA
jgi:hypothetical protein